MNTTYTKSYQVWDYIRRTAKPINVDNTIARFIDLEKYSSKFNGYTMSPCATDDSGIRYTTRKSQFSSIDGLYSYLDSCIDGSLVLHSATIIYTMVHTSYNDDLVHFDIDVPYINAEISVRFGSVNTINAVE